jgi:hypothetical protein
MSAFRVSWLVLVAIAPIVVYLKIAAQTAERRTASEELVAEKSSTCPALDEEDLASRDKRAVAWRCLEGQKWIVLLNGTRQGGAYDEVRSLTFSPDDRHLAFAARRDKRWMLVVDAVEPAATYEDIGAPVFSPQGGHLAYPAKQDKRWVMVQSGSSEHSATTYDDVGLPVFSSDGAQIAFPAKPAKKWILVLNGTPTGPELDEIISRRFSLDGRRVAHVGRRGRKLVVVMDGNEGPPFDILGGLEFSPDSRRFAYAGADVKRGFGKQKALGRVVIDGTPGPEHEGMQIGSLLQNAMGSTQELRLGYLPQLWSEAHGITAPVFSPDGSHVAYAARQGKDATAVVIDGEAGSAVSPIVAGPVFSSDGRRIAIVVLKEGAITLLVDGASVGPSATGGTDFIADMFFSPDNRRIAYIGVAGGSWYEAGLTRRAKRRVYVDGVAGREYDALFLGHLQFTPDGRSVTYVCGGVSEGSRDVAFVVVNDREGRRYDDILGRPRIEPDESSVSYIGQSGRMFYRVTQALGQETSN